MNKDYTIRKDKLGLLYMFSKMFGILAILILASCSKVATIEVKPDKIAVLDLAEKAIDIDIEAGKIIGTSGAMEYSINSTDGTDGTWNAANEGNTPVVFTEGNVYVRETAFPWNVHLVKTIKPGMILYDLDGVDINVAEGKILGTSDYMEYSLNSTDGTNGTWITASASNTTADFIAGKVYVRQALAPSNVRLVATIQPAGAAPTLVGNDDTNTIAGLTAIHEYKIDDGTWNAGTVVPDLTGTKSVQIRLIATATKLASLIQTISFTAGPILYDNFEGTADLASRGWIFTGTLPVFSTTTPGGGTQSVSLEKTGSMNKTFDLVQDATIEWKMKAQNAASSIYIGLYEGTTTTSGVVRFNLFNQVFRYYSVLPVASVAVANVAYGQWNTYRVELTGNKLNVYINGIKVGTEYLTIDNGARQKISRINFQQMNAADPVFIDDVKITVK